MYYVGDEVYREGPKFLIRTILNRKTCSLYFKDWNMLEFVDYPLDIKGLKKVSYNGPI